MTTIGLSVSGECREIMRGPERAPRGPDPDPRPLIQISLGNDTRLVEQQNACLDAAFMGQVQASVVGMLRQRLEAQKYKIVPAIDGEPMLRVHLKLTRLRESSVLFERKDREGDPTCQKTCGTPACQEYRFVGQLQMEAGFDGPELPGAGPQHSELREMFTAIRLHPSTLAKGALLEQMWGSTSGIDSVVTCNASGARAYLQDSSHFNWERSREIMSRWLEKELAPMFAPYNEEFKLAFFNVKGAPDNEAGLKAAKENDFFQAAQSFLAALNAGTKVGHPQDRARLLYNAAAAKMQLGDHRTAQDLLDQSLATSETDEARALRKELARRIADDAKM